MRTRLPAILLVFFVGCSSAAAAGHGVILQYHHFGKDTPPSTSVTLDQFRQHAAYLEKNGFIIWPLEKMIQNLKAGSPLPEKCAAITIDDAYVSIYEKAFPILKEKGWPFTVFVATQAVDKNYKNMLSWDQMREMAGHGADFGPHTHTHLYLLKRLDRESEAQWATRIKADITRSVTRIQEEVGRVVPLFAYPFGEYNPAIKGMVTAMRLTGLGQQSGPVWTGSDFGAVPRFAMAAGYADMESFTTKVNSLPLPVTAVTPEDPVVSEENLKPVLRLTLGEGEYDRESLACFLSGHGPIDLSWVDRKNQVLEVKSSRPLPEGRSRYNITARHRDGSRYFWYSHLWIRGRQP
ncbi:polysaccharide deacetylase family protein [Desulfospira joergensenii]|uniref:polysaccharide deacetylase family protein n=1 Tax=Desulfospira joergensenii TaxID=53329 RepID=UPI0003B5E3C1|nr:polysaccharide deacetylase family protein [Desulfospira joergensenii]